MAEELYDPNRCVQCKKRQVDHTAIFPEEDGYFYLYLCTDSVPGDLYRPMTPLELALWIEEQHERTDKQ